MSSCHDLSLSAKIDFLAAYIIMTSSETFAIMTKLTSDPVTLRQLHLCHMVFRLNAAEQLHARNRFRMVALNDDSIGGRIYRSTLHGRLDGMYAYIGAVFDDMIKCYSICGDRHGKYIDNMLGMRSRCTYTNGRRDGTHTIYYNNGFIMRESMYVDGKLHGERTSYRNDGTLYKRRVYLNDVKQGKSVVYPPGVTRN